MQKHTRLKNKIVIQFDVVKYVLLCCQSIKANRINVSECLLDSRPVCLNSKLDTFPTEHPFIEKNVLLCK